MIVRGGQLGSVDRLVKVGDVFATSDVFETERKEKEKRNAAGKIITPPPGSVLPPVLSSRLRTYSLLKVTEINPDGTLKCEPLGRGFQKGPRNHIGFRCMKLGTVEGPLVIKLVGANNPAMLGSVRVVATEKGFNATEDNGNRLDFKDGLFWLARPLSNVACVTAFVGTSANIKRFPVPILSSDVVTLPFEIQEGAEELAEFSLLARAVINRLADARQAQAICFEATARLIKIQRNTEALARAKGGRQAAESARISIKEDLEILQKKAETMANAASVAEFITTITRNLSALEKFNEQLSEHIKTLELVVKRENDPASVAKENEVRTKEALIQLLLSRGEIDEALNVYDQLLTILPMDAGVKAAKEKLQAEWKPKNDEHAKARAYLLKNWPAVSTIPEYRDSLPELTRSIDVCKKNGDKFTLRKLLMIFSSAAVKLNELNAALDPNSEADRKLAGDVQ